jgi:hypothetical protein
MPAGKMRGGMFLLVGLVLLFAACEKEIRADDYDGKKVEILLSANITNYHTADDLVRSSGAREPISMMIPLDDDFHLRATLAPDAEGELRDDTEPFMDGQKLCFTAFKPDESAQVATAVYTYSDADGKWMSNAPLMLVPDDSKEYRFVAYSYFASTATPSETGIDPSNDLVWGMSGNTKIVGEAVADRTVTIRMKHKFARVKVRVRSTKIPSATITVLSDVEVMGGKVAALDPFTGGITLGGAATQDVDITAPPAKNDIESSYRTVTPVGAGTVSVKLGTLKVSASSTIFYDKMAEFAGTLDEGESYTLVVDLNRDAGFAYSNIYWQKVADPLDAKYPGYLTFDTTDKGNQGYQGVFFKLGSLVGISPAQVEGSDAYVNQDVPIYVPTYNSTTPKSSTWEATTSSVKNWPAWAKTTSGSAALTTHIPYMDGIYAGTGTDYTNSSMYVMDDDQNDPETMWKECRGDICQYLSETGAVAGDYRLPTSKEIYPKATGWTVGGSQKTVNTTVGNAEGTVDLIKSPINGAWRRYTVTFPVSGYRNNTGVLHNVLVSGYYWSGSVASAINGYYLYVAYGSVGEYKDDRSEARAVRCIKKD